MTTYSKAILSGSTDGRGVVVAATASAGTTIHTGSATAATLHEVWLYASNPDTVSHTLTVQWGGTTAVSDDIIATIPARSSLVLIAPGLLIKGNATPLVVRAYADTTNKVILHGYANVIA